jgi:prepilin peptidase CpaA
LNIDTLDPALAWLALGVLLLLCIIATWQDISTRRLPNWLCGLTALAGMLSTATLYGLPVAGSALLHAMIALIVGMALFKIKFIGGGDAKFYAAAACWFPLGQGLAFLGFTSIVGFFMALFFIFKGTRHGGMTRSEKARQRNVPYGVAIAAGAMAAALMDKF